MGHGILNPSWSFSAVAEVCCFIVLRMAFITPVVTFLASRAWFTRFSFRCLFLEHAFSYDFLLHSQSNLIVALATVAVEQRQLLVNLLCIVL